MIKIKKLNSFKPYFIAHFEYESRNVGEVFSDRVKISLTNPYINRLCLLLNSPTFCHAKLSKDYLTHLFSDKLITEEDFIFLTNIFYPNILDAAKYANIDESLKKFYSGLGRTENYKEYRFIRIRLCYIDEGGLSHDTEIFPDDPSIENQITFE